MLVGSYSIAVGDTRRAEIDYGDWLHHPGDKITAATSTLIPAPGGTSSLGTTSLDPTKTKVWVFVTAGALNEVFTVQVQVTDTLGQVVHDTLTFTVVSP